MKKMLWRRTAFLYLKKTYKFGIDKYSDFWKISLTDFENFVLRKTHLKFEILFTFRYNFFSYWHIVTNSTLI